MTSGREQCTLSPFLGPKGAQSCICASSWGASRPLEDRWCGEPANCPGPKEKLAKILRSWSTPTQRLC